MSIVYPILSGNVLADETPTDVALDRLAQETHAALSDAFPGWEVTCPVLRRTSGIRRVVVASGEPADEDRAHAVAERAWLAWLRTLTAEDVVLG